MQVIRYVSLLVFVIACSSPGPHNDPAPAVGSAPPVARDASAVPAPLDATAVVAVAAIDAAPATPTHVAHSDPGCPAQQPASGATCGPEGSMKSLRCEYATTTCLCDNPRKTYCGGRQMGLVPSTWRCAPLWRKDGCPTIAPTETTAGKPACDTPDQRCAYSQPCCNGTFTCTGGVWTGTLRCVNDRP